ncbi:MAG TPA: LamG domain-containing protein [Kofleriaceae bacterium]|nr:LamG domain-containing protein [Kofleriaceae bacterium]
MRWLALLCAAGCGRVSFDPLATGDAGGGGGSDSGGVDAIPLPAAIAHWKLDEGTGLQTFDAINATPGNLNAGASSVAPMWVTTSAPRPAGFAVQFMGDGDAISIGTVPLLANLPALTIAGWIRSTDVTDMATSKCMFDKGTTGVAGWAVEIGRDGDGSLGLAAYFGATTAYISTPTNALSPNQWIHIAATWTGSASASGMHLYVDGAEVLPVISTDAVGTRPSDSAEGATINCNSSVSLPGQIDDVIIFDRVLTAQQISQLYGS